MPASQHCVSLDIRCEQYIGLGPTYQCICSGENDESVISLPILFDEFGDIVPFYRSACAHVV
jgi:hypothetical protein